MNIRNVIDTLPLFADAGGEVLFKEFRKKYSLPSDLGQMDLLYAAVYFMATAGRNIRYLGYGAGAVCKQYLPDFSALGTKLEGIWDRNAGNIAIAGETIILPDWSSLDESQFGVVFIADKGIQNDVITAFYTNGACAACTPQDAIQMFTGMRRYGDWIRKNPDFAREVCQRISSLLYCGDVNDERLPVLYRFILNDGKDEDAETLPFDRLHALDASLLCKRLLNRLRYDTTDAQWLTQVEKSCANLLAARHEIEFLRCYELLLRTTLANGIRSWEYPLILHDTYPYDKYATYFIIKEINNFVLEDSHTSDFIERLYGLSSKSIPISALYAEQLLNKNQILEALEVIRAARIYAPNSLLANDIFIKIAKAAAAHGIRINEPISQVDLSERYCNSGLVYATCAGYDAFGKQGMFVPCFRTMQCTAVPSGQFWLSDDWQEFRHSIVNGSFKYCLRNQCNNIISGALPKREDVTDISLLRLLDGQIDENVPLRELNLSYDSHCNLQCPSCRRSFVSHTKEYEKELDEFFERDIRPHLSGLRRLAISGCGEALVSPHSRRILQSLSKTKYPELNVELRTNGISLTARAWEKLGAGSECIDHVAVSIDGGTKTTFEKLRYPAKWDKLIENMQFIKALRDSNQIKLLQISVVVQSGNIKELIDIIKLGIEFNADVITFAQMTNWGAMSDKEYFEANPFFPGHELHETMIAEFNKIGQIRNDIQASRSSLIPQGHKKLHIALHFESGQYIS